MRHPETVYRGERLAGPDGEILGTRVIVLERSGFHHPLALDRSLRVRTHSPTGFEWGYDGGGPNQLALALLLDVTDDRLLAECCYHLFRSMLVSMWGPTWSLTAGEVIAWIDRWQREQRQVEEVEAGIQPFVLEPSAVGANGGAA